MGRLIRSGNRRRAGFTIMELMVAMAIVLVVLAVAVPLYQKAVIRARESVLRQNLFSLRAVIDEYTYDKQKAPQQLDDLVKEGYLRQIPVDPIAQTRNWKITMEDAGTSASSEPGIWNVQSTSEKTSLEGTPYSEW